MQFTEHPGRPQSPTAVILPGADYPSQAPMLYWAQGILLSAGWRVLEGAWDDADRAAAGPQQAVDRILDAVPSDGEIGLVIGKSLGSFALPRCVDDGIPGIWLTPLLNIADIAIALTKADVDQLMIGGDADRHWLPDRVSQTSRAARFVIPDASHSLRIGDNWRTSLDAQERALVRMSDHVELIRNRAALRTAFTDSDLGLRRGVVELAPASDAWGRVFADVQAVLAATAPASVTAIEHIGSTSVPGLDAKAILDIGITVRPGTRLASLDGWLIGLGMLLRGDDDDIRPDRMYGYELEPMVRLANIHVVEEGSDDIRRYRGFRDHLRANPADRDAYAALKRTLAAQHPGDRLAYIDGKQDFITARRGDEP